MSRATEVCSCGARIEIETQMVALGYRLDEWRKSHRHEMPDGELPEFGRIVERGRWERMAPTSYQDRDPASGPNE